MKVMTILGTRPEVIKLSRVLAALDRWTRHVLVHTGQNYDFELNEIFFRDLEIRPPDHFLGAAGANAAETIGAIVPRADQVMDLERPDAVLVLGDTNSCLSAYAAKRRRIPVFHMEAGNRCFDERVPEEINRRLVDQLSDVNLPYSDIARQYLLREGLAPDRVIKTGSPMFEVLTHYASKIAASDVLERMGLAPGSYFLVSAHREENVDAPRRLARFIELLNGLAEDSGSRVLVSTHPRTRRRIAAASVKVSARVELAPPFGFCDYVRLQQEARVVLSDSGTITEESSILNFPALNLRDVQERPEGMEEASVILTGMDLAAVRSALPLAEAQGRGPERKLRVVTDYIVPNVSEKIVRIILSYAPYVRRVVWREYGTIEPG